MIHKFYKEDNLWYIDLPQFIEEGLGTTANLLMVDGADTFLDKLSSNGTNVTVRLEVKPFEGYEYKLVKESIGLNQDVLDTVGHAKVDYGAYYNVQEIEHRLWLCPVTEYVFNGSYPNEIYIKKL